uniref:RING-type domain-containing protein n=1 Tax=Compsopogon caeruleus TaxID=31354 RepID=A0A7S1T872_9RHOD|mmetsp:Transcript_1286/g.2704  ORF Transcript_1286/g.2704 Transcript_1286/m.2704 type:complete len:185 (+) Transcript_1286:705-1259(+)
MNAGDVAILIAVMMTVVSFCKVCRILHRWPRQPRVPSSPSALARDRISPRAPDQASRAEGHVLNSIEINDMLERFSRRQKNARSMRLSSKSVCESECCAICLDDLGQTKVGYGKVVELPKCLHKFHTTCMQNFLQRGIIHQCPLCRGDLVSAFRDCTQDLRTAKEGSMVFITSGRYQDIPRYNS